MLSNTPQFKTVLPLDAKNVMSVLNDPRVKKIATEMNAINSVQRFIPVLTQIAAQG